jgi:hypothetical protein
MADQPQTAGVFVRENSQNFEKLELWESCHTKLHTNVIDLVVLRKRVFLCLL